MCVVLLYPARRWLQAHIHDRITPFVLSFLLNSFVCGAIEFFLGLVVNAQLQLWDYSDLPFNIMGQVCLQNSLCFGVISTAIVWIVYPLIERVVGRTSKDVMNVIFVGNRRLLCSAAVSLHDKHRYACHCGIGKSVPDKKGADRRQVSPYRGTVIVTRVPTPSRERMSMVPPWLSTTHFAIESPSPDPLEPDSRALSAR